jgi:hypothetical protein
VKEVRIQWNPLEIAELINGDCTCLVMVGSLRCSYRVVQVVPGPADGLCVVVCMAPIEVVICERAGLMMLKVGSQTEEISASSVLQTSPASHTSVRVRAVE